MLQVLQTIHNWSILYPGAYFGGVIILLLLTCGGWFKLGSTRLAVAGPAPARRRFIVSWRFRPFVHTVICQVANVLVAGKLETDIDFVAVSLAIRIQ